eukprot:TRINITY_DN8944_c0_g1_i1.p1 TRINITY_DN8944_c0_g1~~TRINITY_DN8944_c0_g1_i1.p1  ORF type:complete len:548 (-),score=86.01 TRINITY_DN8944_c0_g1_i1:393-1949(-)
MTNSTSITQKLANSAKTLAPNHVLGIKRYYYSADLMIRQADEYRRDGNLEQLYVMLLRFSSLVIETLPKHKEFSGSDRRYHALKTVLAGKFLPEAETVKQQLQANELSQISPPNPQGTQIVRGNEPDAFDFKDTRASQPTALTNNLGQIIEITNVPMHLSKQNQKQQLQSQQQQLQPEEPVYKSKYQVKGEALHRHMLTAPTQDLQNQNQRGYQKKLSVSSSSLYPAFGESDQEMPTAPAFDLMSWSEGDSIVSNGEIPKPSAPEQQLSLLDTPLIVQPELGPQQLEVVYTPAPTQPPPPGATCNHRPPPPPEAQQKQIIPLEAGPFSFPHEQLQQDGLRNIEISNNLIQDFLDLAIANTRRGIESCALLAGKLKTKENVFFVNTLLVPKQKGSTDQVEMLQEEEYMMEMIEKDLYPLGWIHTHPTQTCFMSSIDVHTQCGRQTEMPEAIGIVMAPQDSNRKCGIFRLSTPGGLELVQKCKMSGFHMHPSTSTGQRLYEDAGHVYLNPRIKHSYVDLR